jgi:hypothetical protein
VIVCIEVDAAELTSNDDLAVGLQSEASDESVRRERRINDGSERPVRIQPRDLRTRTAVDLREETADQDLAIGLNQNSSDRRIDRHRERSIVRVISIHPLEEIIHRYKRLAVW